MMGNYKKFQWTKVLFAFVVLVQVIGTTNALRKCHQCSGINCQRTTFAQTEQCEDDLDICVTIFEGDTVQAQGCLLQLTTEMRTKCNLANANEALECHKCSSDLCNNLGKSDYQCIQCDSNNDMNCRNNMDKLLPTRCPIARTTNSYCLVSDDGERTIRACAGSLAEQKNCLARSDCMLCSPSELSGCNGVQVKAADSGDGGSGSGSGSGDGGSGSGSGDGGSGSGSGDGGSGSGSGDGGSGSGSGDGGSGSGSGDGGSGSGSGDGSSGSGSGDGGSGSGSGDGGSGSGSGDGGSGSGDGGSGSGSGDGGSGSGSGDGGSGSGSGDGGSGSGSGSGDGGSGSGNSSPAFYKFKLSSLAIFTLIPFLLHL